MPTQTELGDLIRIDPTVAGFADLETNHDAMLRAIDHSLAERAAIFAALEAVWANGGDAYFTATGGDDGIRLGTRPHPARRATKVYGRLHFRNDRLIFSSSQAGARNQYVLDAHGAFTGSFRAFLGVLNPHGHRLPGAAPYNHATVMTRTSRNRPCNFPRV